MKIIGVNIGALTVKIVALGDHDRRSTVVPHQGRPLDVIQVLLHKGEFADFDSIGVSGHLGHISEAKAIQRALSELNT
ncbi:MAG: hypothetical protein OEN50_15590, partial [Deltaproteobacteria bacterium]|nr:hypothetical protein [Deltaproteobacteria bacterium]